MCIRDSLREHATKLLLRAKHVCPEQRLVYGGCTRNWEYDGKWSPGQCAQYNRAAHQLVKYVKINADVSAMTGFTLFEGLNIVDRIGHVSHESMDLMVEIFVKTTRWGMVRTVSSVPWYRSLLWGCPQAGILYIHRRDQGQMMCIACAEIGNTIKDSSALQRIVNKSCIHVRIYCNVMHTRWVHLYMYMHMRV